MSDTNAKTPETKLVPMTFQFSEAATATLMNVFVSAYGVKKLERKSVAQQNNLFAKWLRDRMCDAVKSKRNSLLTTEYNQNQKDVDDLVDSGVSRSEAEQQIFGMSGTRARVVLKNTKAEPLFSYKDATASKVEAPAATGVAAKVEAATK